VTQTAAPASATPTGAAVRGATVLPAVRRDIGLRTADGLRLVGELALPAGREPAATLVMCHPLPTHGGSMDSHVFRKASFRLPALAGLAVLRFNTRGTESPRGRSEGAFEDGVGERFDVQAAVDLALAQGLPAPWLVGWSFGTDLALKYGAVEPLASRTAGAVLLSPPLRRAGDADLDAWAASGKPLAVLVPEHDDFLRPAEAARRFARVPQARVVPMEGARHLWVGEKHVSGALSGIVEAVLGTAEAQHPPIPGTARAGPAGR
jgi:alpha/beta superfamily hydrolase